MFAFQKRITAASALFCISVSFLSAFAVDVRANTGRSQRQESGSAAPAVTAIMSDGFADPDMDGKAGPGSEITYTARIENNGSSDATGVTFAVTADSNSTLVANSLSVQPGLSGVFLRCAFDTAGGGSGNCSFTSSNYGSTGNDNYSIIGGQGSLLNVAASGTSYDSGAGVFSFNAVVQNLLAQKLGTIDGMTPDSEGVRLFISRAPVTSGSGVITAANADGFQTFTGANQPFFRYNEILDSLSSSAAKNIQLNVPSTVGTFNVDFLVSTKAQAKLVINEVLANPGGTISDANGEWFEVTNTGAFPVNMLNFKIGDSAASGDRPLQTIPTDLIVDPGALVTFGNTSNTTNNGGVPIDYVYGSALALANSLDAVRIVSPVADLEIDRVSYVSAAISAQNGISRELKNPALDNSNMDGSNWADATVTSVYGPGGRGTPKAQNSGYTPFAGFNDVEDVAAVYAPEKRERPTIKLSGETVNSNLGILAPGDFVDVVFKVTTSNPLPSGVNHLSVQGTVAGSNFTSVGTDDPATGAAGDATVTPILAPTAGQGSLSGRIITPDGGGVKGVYVRVMGGSLQSPRIAITNPFGHYAIEDLQVGESYIVSVASKSYVFETSVLVVTLNDQVTDADFRVIR